MYAILDFKMNLKLFKLNAQFTLKIHIISTTDRSYRTKDIFLQNKKNISNKKNWYNYHHY